MHKCTLPKIRFLSYFFVQAQEKRSVISASAQVSDPMIVTGGGDRPRRSVPVVAERLRPADDPATAAAGGPRGRGRGRRRGRVGPVGGGRPGGGGHHARPPLLLALVGPLQRRCQVSHSRSCPPPLVSLLLPLVSLSITKWPLYNS